MARQPPPINFSELFDFENGPLSGKRKREGETSSVLNNEGERVMLNVIKRCVTDFYIPLKTAPVSHLKKLLKMRGGRDEKFTEKAEIIAKLNVGGEGNEDMCAICHETMTKTELATLWPCGHSFHMTCCLDFEAKRALRCGAREEVSCQMCMKVAKKKYV